MSKIIEAIEKEYMKSEVPAIAVGDSVKVYVKVVEGTRERLQAFEGIVIAKKNGSVRETITVRRVSFGVGIERTFPIHSPRIDKIEVVRHGKVRRAKLYYLRNLYGKAAKITEKSNVFPYIAAIFKRNGREFSSVSFYIFVCKKRADIFGALFSCF